MPLLKINKMPFVLTALVLTACANTGTPSATTIKTLEVPVMPAPPAVLMVPPVRPAPPENGSVRALLEHAAEFGAYTAELEIQNAGWREWVRGNYQLKVNSSNLKETLKSSEAGK